MSLDRFWNTVDIFRKSESLSSQDVRDVDHAFQNILKYHKSNDCHQQAGYSQYFPRYLEKLSDVENPNILKQLIHHKYVREYQLEKLRNIIFDRRKAVESMCNHDWQHDPTERDDRSRYACIKCNAFR